MNANEGAARDDDNNDIIAVDGREMIFFMKFEGGLVFGMTNEH